MDFDTTVKMALYRSIADTARMPDAAQLAGGLGVPAAEVEQAFLRLHQKRLLVPEPGAPGRIRMAPPFSGVETPFPVQIGTRRYFANCVWDALGVAAALHQDAAVDSTDAHTGEPLPMEVRGGRPLPQPWVAHFAVPAALWWKDIVYT